MTATTVSRADREEALERLGRVAIATQGVLYAVVGLLAVQVARGDSDAKASQRGAIESVARQPFGQVLLVVLVVGLVAHALWRAVLAIRGDGGEEDGKSAAKRVANAARAVLYVSFTVVAVRILTSSGGGGGGGGSSEKKSTALVLSWPGGTWLVMAAGLAIIGAGLWNAKRAISRSFLEALDLSSLDEGRRRTVEGLGVAGYLARFVAFSLVGWFLVTAGRQHDAGETRGLDQSLRELATTSYGPILLLVLAIGMVLFGAYRICDGLLRRRSEITHA